MSYTDRVSWIFCHQKEIKITGDVESRHLVSYHTSFSCYKQMFKRKCSGICMSVPERDLFQLRFISESCASCQKEI